MPSEFPGTSRNSCAYVALVVCAWILASLPTPALSQTEESSVITDEEDLEMTSALDEILDRLRSQPIDLRKATIEELLMIPGITRRTAAAIIAGVGSGRISTLDNIENVFGVQSGTRELLRPFVFLGPYAEAWKSTARTTAASTRRSYDQDPSIRVSQRLHWVSTSSWMQGRFSEADIGVHKNLNRDGVRPSITGLIRTTVDEHWGLCLGWFQLRGGLALSASGTRSSVMDPVSWDRAFASRPGIQRMSMTDERSNMRGLAADVHWESCRFVAVAGTSMDDNTTTWAMSGDMNFGSIRSKVCIVDRGPLSGEKEVSGSFGNTSAEGSMFMEGRFPYREKPSGAFQASYDLDPTIEGSVLIRSLNRTGRVVVPSVYHGSRREDGGTLALRIRVVKNWSCQLVIDRFRTQDPADVTERWLHGSGIRSSISMSPAPRTTLTAEMQSTRRWVNSSTPDMVTWRHENRKRWNMRSTIEGEFGFRWIAGIQHERREGHSELEGSEASVLWTDIGWKGKSVQLRTRWMLFDVHKGMTAYASFPASAGSFGGTPVSGEGAGVGILIVWGFSESGSVSLSWRTMGNWLHEGLDIRRDKDDASIQADFRL